MVKISKLVEIPEKDSRLILIQIATIVVLFSSSVTVILITTILSFTTNFGCPGKWVEYCKDCLYLVDAALRIQKEISELEDKLRKCQEKMVMKIKSTSKKISKNRSPESSEKLGDEITRVTEETREFVNSKSTTGKNSNETVSQAVCVLSPEPEVASDAENDNEPLEYPSAPPSPPDNFDLDPSYADNRGPPSPTPEQVDLKPSSTEKPKLSAEDRCRIKNRAKSNANDLRLLESLNCGGYTCSLCPITLNKPMSFLKFYRHLIFHSQRPFKCSVCNVYWSSPVELEKNPFVNENPSISHVCSEQTLVNLSGENGKVVPGGIWECAWCPQKFDRKIERNSHEKKDHSRSKILLKNKYSCLSCSKSYRDLKEWLLHRALEHPRIAAISCLFCDYSAAIKTKEGIDVLNLTEMKKHLSSKHPTCKNLFVSPETCDFCGIPFKFGKDNLTKHIKDDHRLTSGMCTYKCPCCYFRTNKLLNLREHLNLHHSLNPPVLPPSELPERRKEYRLKEEEKLKEKVICDVCGKMLRGGLILMEHKLRQHGIEPKDMSEYNGRKMYKCERGDECGGFLTMFRAKIDEHMIKMHGMETKWKCEECGKEFANNSHLSRHKEIHRNKGVKPHQCEICGNSFAVRNYLYIHMRLSHQNKPFASTNRKRTTRKGGSRVGRGITAVGDQGSSVDSLGMLGLGQQPPTQMCSAAISNRESTNRDYRKDGDESGDMDIS